MARVVFTASADADSAGILKYLDAKAGRVIATKYAGLFRDFYGRLSNHPDQCPSRGNLGANVRIGIVPPYVVIYRHIEGDDTVTILRIIHARRRITGKLLASELR